MVPQTGPDFRDSASFVRWVQGGPPPWGQAISARAALRVLPLVALALETPDERVPFRQKQDLILAVFRANFVTWAARKYPAHEMTAAARVAAEAAAAYVAHAVAAAHAAAYAAHAAADAAHAADAAAAAHNAAATDADVGADAAIQDSIREDAAWLQAQGLSADRDAQATALIGRPLWPSDVRGDSNYRANLPPWARAPLDRMANNAGLKEAGFEHWIAWYRKIIPNRRDGTPTSHFGEAVDIRIATQPDEWWNRDPKEVNRDIAEWFDGEGFESLPEPPAQSPAAYAFEWQHGRIDVVPPENDPNDSEVARDLSEEALRKARPLHAKLVDTNSDPRVAGSVSSIIDLLERGLHNLRPGLLRSRSRSIEADARAFGSGDGEFELFPGAVAQLIDLANTLEDLQGCFPQLREIEAEVLALQIEGADASFVEAQLDTIVEAARGDSSIVAEATSEALETIAEIAAEPQPAAVRSKRLAEYALVIRNFLAQLGKVGRETAIAGGLASTGKRVWEKAEPKIIDGVADGLGSVARPATIVAIGSLVGLVFGPTAGIATVLAGFGKVDKLLRLLAKRYGVNIDDKDRDVDDENSDRS